MRFQFRRIGPAPTAETEFGVSEVLIAQRLGMIHKAAKPTRTIQDTTVNMRPADRLADTLPPAGAGAGAAADTPLRDRCLTALPLSLDI
ncbi:hypothetical protein GCM10009630_19030 [Kribbella jejuensis]